LCVEISFQRCQMPDLSATKTHSESYYLLLNYQSLCDTKAGFPVCWFLTNKEQHVCKQHSAICSIPQGPILIHTFLETWKHTSLSKLIPIYMENN